MPIVTGRGPAGRSERLPRPLVICLALLASLPLALTLAGALYLAVRGRPLGFDRTWFIGFSRTAGDQPYTDRVPQGFGYQTWCGGNSVTRYIVARSWSLRVGGAAYFVVQRINPAEAPAVAGVSPEGGD